MAGHLWSDRLALWLLEAMMLVVQRSDDHLGTWVSRRNSHVLHTAVQAAGQILAGVIGGQQAIRVLAQHSLRPGISPQEVHLKDEMPTRIFIPGPPPPEGVIPFMQWRAPKVNFAPGRVVYSMEVEYESEEEEDEDEFHTPQEGNPLYQTPRPLKVRRQE